MTHPPSRAGRFVRQPTGYRAFIPATLPPDPPILLDTSLSGLLSRADQAVGRLDGVTHTLPNADLFIAMYVKQEAVLSSQIEGTQSSLEDILTFELDPHGRETPQDVAEVINYVRAMNFGFDRLATLPLSLRLIQEIHEILLEDARGAAKQPGEFRTSQNWIGAGNVTLAQAAYVPPPPAQMWESLSDLEQFLHEERSLPVLVHCGIAHAQFETIHPFLDGNGRVGRLLITFLLSHRHLLHRPVLYLSTFLKRHRAEYYDRLTAIREHGDWEGWLRFFLSGVAEAAEDATATALAIVALREEHRSVIHDQDLGINGLRLLDLLFDHPVVNVRFIQEHLSVVYATANNLVRQFEALGLLHEVTGGKKNRRFRYSPYLQLFATPDTDLDSLSATTTTEGVPSL